MCLVRPAAGVGTGTSPEAQGRDDPEGEAQWAADGRLGVPQRSVGSMAAGVSPGIVAMASDEVVTF
ncbi:hypothetical protein AB0D91_47015 [Streptomyces canus]|uniref:hypothetical protein n=1 Tax=Streptomyces canus TaxID=58343 RepID=UPI0033E24448